MFFSIFGNMFPDKKNKLSPVDLCIALYPNSVDMIEFLSSIEIPEIESEEKVISKMASWLEENNTVFWLLTCASIDELLEQGKIKYNKEGYLQLNKKGKRK